MKTVNRKNALKAIKTTALVAAMTGVLSIPAVAGSRYATDSYSHYDYARVVDVSQIIEKVSFTEPVERCWNEKVRHYNRHASNSKTPDVIGAIVGAAVGNRFGKGSGRDAATVAGALLGGSIGRDIRKKHHHHRGDSYVKTVRQCETHEEVRYEDRVSGYDVKYRYKGRVYTTQMDSHPGDEIKVQVNVVPVQ